MRTLTTSKLTERTIRLSIWAGDVAEATALAADALALVALGWAPPEGWTRTMWEGFLHAAPGGARVALRAAEAKTMMRINRDAVSI